MQRAAANGKRVQANMGAKNHAVVLPDADVDSTVKALTGGDLNSQSFSKPGIQNLKVWVDADVDSTVKALTGGGLNSQSFSKPGMRNLKV